MGSFKKLIILLWITVGCQSTPGNTQIPSFVETPQTSPHAGGDERTTIEAGTAHTTTPSLCKQSQESWQGIENQTSQHSLTISNPTRLGYQIVDVANLASDIFTIAQDNCTKTILAAGQTCQLQINFLPTGPGRFVGVIKVAYADSNAENEALSHLLYIDATSRAATPPPTPPPPSTSTADNDRSANGGSIDIKYYLCLILLIWLKRRYFSRPIMRAINPQGMR